MISTTPILAWYSTSMDLESKVALSSSYYFDVLLCSIQYWNEHCLEFSCFIKSRVIWLQCILMNSHRSMRTEDSKLSRKDSLQLSVKIYLWIFLQLLLWIFSEEDSGRKAEYWNVWGNNYDSNKFSDWLENNCHINSDNNCSNCGDWLQ